MECPKCGAANAPESLECQRCGAPLRSEEKPGPTSWNVSSALERAYLAYKQEDLETAILECQRALEAEPYNEEAMELLAQLEEKQGNFAAAVKALERFLNIHPQSVAHRLRLEELKRRAEQVATSPPPATPPSSQENTRLSVTLILATTILMLSAAIAILAYEWGRSTQMSLSQTTFPPLDLAARLPRTSLPYSNSPMDASQLSSSSQFPFSRENISHLASPNPAPSQPTPNTKSYLTNQHGSVAITNAPAPSSLGVPPAPVNAPSSPPHRIVLPASDTGSNDSTVVIPVGPSAQQTPSSDTSSQGGAQDTTVVHVYHSSAPSGEASDSTSRSYIAMGQRLQLNGQYDQAITAYKKALPHAGDDTGFVYQQIAICYQREGKKEEAINNFRQAQNAYQQLLEAGRRTAEARAGIAACEQGIKLCSP